MGYRTFSARQRGYQPVRFDDSTGRAWWFPARIPLRKMVPVLTLLGVIDADQRGVPIPAMIGFQILEAFAPATREAADAAWEEDRQAGGHDGLDVPAYTCWEDLGDMDSGDAAFAGVALYQAYALGASGDDPTPEEEVDDGPPAPAPDSSG